MKDTHGGNIWQAAVEAGVDPSGIIDFSASINPFGPSQAVVEAVKDAINIIPPYPDPACAELRKALAAHHGIMPDQVIAGNGSTEFIYLIPQVFKPKSALIIEPAFSEYRNSLELHGCAVESFILREDDGFCLDVARLEGELRKGHTLLYIANPANPTGVLIKKGQMREVAGLCEDLGVTLVIDEAFMDFCEEGNPPEGESFKDEVKTFRGIVVLRSMTKFFAIAGLRLGYVIADAGTIKKISGYVPPWSVNTLAAVAGVHALKDRAYMELARRRIEEEREAFLAMLRAIGAFKTYPSAANFLMLRITSGGLPAHRLKEALLKKRMLVRDLSAFRGLGSDYIRVAVRTRQDNTALAAAVSGVLHEMVPAG